MAHPAHSYATHHRHTSAHGQRTIDILAYVVGIGGNAAALPQVVAAWQGPAPGLAIATWSLFSLVCIVWLVYAIAHRQKPLIAAQVTGLSLNLAVVIGWWVHNT